VEEKRTATLNERISAAIRCVESGYRVAFHFDPIFHYRDWETDYYPIIDLIFEKIDHDAIAWISLGTLRFHPSLKPIIERRFPETFILSGELVHGDDGKMRYPRMIREDIYRKMASAIQAHAESVPLYLCMEPALVWKNALKIIPCGDIRLKGIFF